MDVLLTKTEFENTSVNARDFHTFVVSESLIVIINISRMEQLLSFPLNLPSSPQKSLFLLPPGSFTFHSALVE